MSRKTAERHHHDHDHCEPTIADVLEGQAVQARAIESLKRSLNRSLNQLEKIMAAVDDKLAQLKAAVQASNEAGARLLARVAEDVTYLKEKAEAGVDPATLIAGMDEIIALAEQGTTAFEGADPVPDFPPLPPPVEEGGEGGGTG